MKRKLITALAVLTALTLTAASAAGAPGDRLGFRLLQTLCDGSENVFLSPVSLGIALSMAAEGAGGTTRAQLLEALSDGGGETIPAPALIPALEAAGLRCANAGFIGDGPELKGEYLSVLETDYGAELFPLDSVERVNAWVDVHTDHLIDRLVDEIDPETRLMLLNAVAMDADWAIPFDPLSTRTAAFHAPGGDVEAEFMHNLFEHAAYAERDGTQMIRLDYWDSGLFMLIALPQEGRMSDALGALSENGLSWFDGLDTARVSLALPKFDIVCTRSLTGPLARLGLAGPFSDAADFSGIREDPLKITEVLQKVRIQVDEKGTRAAAVTEIAMADGAAFEPDPPVVMCLDRPFIVIIAEEETGAVCFSGVVADPHQG